MQTKTKLKAGVKTKLVVMVGAGLILCGAAILGTSLARSIKKTAQVGTEYSTGNLGETNTNSKKLAQGEITTPIRKPYSPNALPCVNLLSASTYDPDGDGAANVVFSGGTYWIKDSVTLCTNNYNVPRPADSGLYLGAISIGCSDCYFDCNGSTITGEATGIHLGYDVTARDDSTTVNYAAGFCQNTKTNSCGGNFKQDSTENNVEIRGCNIHNFDTGISIYGSDNNLITGNDISNNKLGIVLTESDDNVLLDNNTNYNVGTSRMSAPPALPAIPTLQAPGAEILDYHAGHGVLLAQSANNIISNHTADYNGEFGVAIFGNGSTGNRFTNNTSNYNSRSGVGILAATGAAAAGNQFNKINACFNNQAGLDPVKAPDILDRNSNTFLNSTCGSVVGGALSSCLNVCRESPLTTATVVSGCGNISASGIYKLNNDIATTAENCLSILANNVTLDCQGHSITGGNSRLGVGIVADGFSNININNCIIKQFLKAVNYKNVTVGELANNSFLRTAYGVHLESTNKVLVRDNLIDSTGSTLIAVGMYLDRSSDNFCYNNDVSHFADATILSMYAVRNEIFANQLHDSARGLHAMALSNDNNIHNNLVYDNGTGLRMMQSNNNLGFNSIYTSETGVDLQNNSTLKNNFICQNTVQDILNGSTGSIFGGNACSMPAFCDRTCAGCGDGLIGTGEVCDSGATPDGCSGGRYCNNTCACVAPVCGNGVVEPGEACEFDDGCPTGRFCNASCSCATPVCGNGMVELAEECDGSDSGCAPFEHCGSGCVCASSYTCGNGTVEVGEACEVNTDCSGGRICDSTCSCTAAQTMLIVTVNSVVSGLGSVFNDYIAALNSDGYNTQVIKLDTADVATCGGGLSPATVPVSADYALYAIPECIEHFDAGHVLVIGGFNQIAQVFDENSGYEFYTDDYYADLNGDKLLDVGLGRIPTTLDNNIDPIRNYIQKVGIPYHSTSLINKDGKLIGYLMRSQPNETAGITVGDNSLMLNYNGADCESLARANPQLCWPAPPNLSNTSIDNSDFAVVAFHGSGLGTQIFADYTSVPPGHLIYTPSSMASYTKWQNSVILGIPCYAGRINNVANISQSILGTAFNLVAPPVAYMGGTNSQWYVDSTADPSGSVCSDDFMTTCLFAKTLDGVAEHETIGEAFSAAKNSYIAGYVTGYYYLQTYQVAHQTLLYGDPTIKIR